MTESQANHALFLLSAMRCTINRMQRDCEAMELAAQDFEASLRKLREPIEINPEVPF